MSGTLLPMPRLSAYDANGHPYAGAKAFFYAAGTTTPVTTYSDLGLSVANANPVVANSAGLFGPIYVGAITVKLVLTDSNGVTVYTQDNIPATGLAGSNVGLGGPVFFGDPNSPVTLTSYPSGATADKGHAGTVVLSIDSGNLQGTYGLRAMLRGAAGGTVTLGLFNVSDGSPDSALVSVTSANTAGELQTSGVITFPAAGAVKNYLVKSKVNAGAGYGWGIELVRLS